jgi:hypothetical protein
VTSAEVQEAIADAQRSAGLTSFAHFWDDGIFESKPERVQHIAWARRLTLLAVGRALASEASATRTQIEEEARRIDLPYEELAQSLASLEQRRILTTEREHVVPRIPFFRRWLESYGPTEIVSQVTDVEAQERLRARLDEAVIAPHEVTKLAKQWGLYRNRQITADDVRSWLAQFGGAFEQRQAMQLLRHVRFYSGLEIRNRFGDAHQRITAGWTRQIPRGSSMFDDVLVVPLDDPGKSGWQYGNIYVVENRIHKQNVVDKSNLATRLGSTRRAIRGVVFVDDFVGTGDNAIAHLSKLGEPVRESLRRSDLAVSLVIVAGFKEGIAKLETWLANQDLPINVYPQELLDDADRAFHTESRFFDDASERMAAFRLFSTFGERISPEHPLGWKDSQALVVFETNVPNNTLPHLWAERDGRKPWTPLFPRF